MDMLRCGSQRQADLEPLLPSLLANYQRETGEHVEASFASSATLATQIENGAPFDCFSQQIWRYLNGSCMTVSPPQHRPRNLMRAARWCCGHGIRAASR